MSWGRVLDAPPIVNLLSKSIKLQNGRSGGSSPGASSWRRLPSLKSSASPSSFRVGAGTTHPYLSQYVEVAQDGFPEIVKNEI